MTELEDASLPARDIGLILIGSSTGGPPVIHQILAALPTDLMTPIVVAQHIVPGFEVGLERWLKETGHRTQLVNQPLPIKPGVVYLLMAHQDTLLTDGYLVPTRGLANKIMPNVDRLFNSAVSQANRCAAVLLSGMGSDGAEGMLALHKAGALTITQAGSTCVVDGMPGSARALGASTIALSPAQIGPHLLQCIRPKAKMARG